MGTIAVIDYGMGNLLSVAKALQKVAPSKLIIITSYYSKEIIKEIKSCKVNINVLQIFPKIKLLKFHG